MSTVQQPEDLLELVSWPSTECVNASSEKTLENALKQVKCPDPAPASSDCVYTPPRGTMQPAQRSRLTNAPALVVIRETLALRRLSQLSDHSIVQSFKKRCRKVQGYREDASLFLESDADEQLIVHVNYNTPVRISSILIQGPDDGHAPKHVKLFSNRPTLGCALIGQWVMRNIRV